MLVILAALSVAVIGGFLMSQIEDVFGDEYRRWGSLGLALVTLGSGVVFTNCVALASPSLAEAVGRALGAKFGTPGRLLIVALGFGILAAVLMSITAEAGGAVAYHPYDFLGIGVALVAMALVMRGVMGYIRASRSTTG